MTTPTPLPRRTVLSGMLGAAAGLLAGCVPVPPNPTRSRGRLPLIDVHNHDASTGIPAGLIVWRQHQVERTFLFGACSSPEAVRDDERTWSAYLDHPDRIVPFFAGVDIHDGGCLEVVREKLERGYCGVGELYAASTHSPAVAATPWRGLHPMDGFLPQIYAICAEYAAPILLHIDPPSGWVLARFEEALDAFPDTRFVFGHANAYNPPEAVAALARRHPNVWIDFFAGFTELNLDSGLALEDWVDVALEFPDRVLVGSESGAFLAGERAAIESMHRFVALLPDPVAGRVASGNAAALVDGQPVTATQRRLLGEAGRLVPATKREAGRLLAGMAADAGRREAG